MQFEPYKNNGIRKAELQVTQLLEDPEQVRQLLEHFLHTPWSSYSLDGQVYTHSPLSFLNPDAHYVHYVSFKHDKQFDPHLIHEPDFWK